MKYFVFNREGGKFDDITADTTIKPAVKTTMSYDNHLILGISDDDGSKIGSYIVLKYGDSMIQWKDIVSDRSPVIDVDYVPKRKKGYEDARAK